MLKVTTEHCDALFRSEHTRHFVSHSIVDDDESRALKQSLAPSVSCTGKTTLLFALHHVVNEPSDSFS
jgi:hypothetical protein